MSPTMTRLMSRTSWLAVLWAVVLAPLAAWCLLWISIAARSHRPGVWIVAAVFILGPLWGMAVMALLTVTLPPRRPAAREPWSPIAGTGPTRATGFDVAAVLSALRRVDEMATERLPAPARARVERICERILSTLPRASQAPLGDREGWAIQQAATSYLPETLDAYLALPPVYASTQVVRDGKTADQLLLEQLDLLGASVDQLADAIRRGDPEAALASGNPA